VQQAVLARHHLHDGAEVQRILQAKEKFELKRTVLLRDGVLLPWRHSGRKIGIDILSGKEKRKR
jgi:hypothetical protein